MKSILVSMVGMNVCYIPFNKMNKYRVILNLMKGIIFFLLIFLVFFSGTDKTKNKLDQKWCFFGHKLINRIAVFTLPPEMFGFYKEHIEFLT